MDIDFVIAWVDGGDPQWRKEKARYDGSADLTQDAGEARYRDWDNLRYWFRAVEAYAPWVRTVHFLTWGHLPPWLNTEHPKLHIVRHEDFIPAQYLPTFNSHTIELNMHRIEGLAEHFVYFNDDMFLNRPVRETDFFCHGLPCDTYVEDAIYFSPDSAGAYNGNDLEIINKHFQKRAQYRKYRWSKYLKLRYGVKNLYRTVVLMPWPWFTGFHYDHTASSFLRSTLEEVWEKEYDILDATCKDRFRSKRNVNQWVFKFWQLASGQFWPRRADFCRAFHLRAFPHPHLAQGIRDGRFGMICINDTSRTTDFEKHKAQVLELFEQKLPRRSEYENA